MQPPLRKPVKIWIFLMIAPVALLILTSMLQFGMRFALSRSSTDTLPPICYGVNVDANNAEQIATECNPEPSEASRVKVFINIVSLAIGMTCAGGILLEPVWIILLVMALNYNKRLDQQAYYQQAAQTPQAGPPSDRAP